MNIPHTASSWTGAGCSATLQDEKRQVKHDQNLLDWTAVSSPDKSGSVVTVINGTNCYYNLGSYYSFHKLLY